MTTDSGTFDVAAFYRFVDLTGVEALRNELEQRCEAGGLLGTVLLADEGVNGTLSGKAGDIRSVFDWLTGRLTLETTLDARWSVATDAPFRRLRVRLKKEIVSLGRPDIRPQSGTGRHVTPDEWNQLLARKDTLVIDTRNRYEVEVGTFPNAVDPHTDSFREFPDFVA
ncbi:MAG: hypothetical protein AAGA61_08135, partial [Pseudomonadota bacterium]